MTVEQVENMLLSREYCKVPSNLQEFEFFFRRENHGINVIYIINYIQGLYITQDQHTHIKDKIVAFFRERGETEVHILSLILSADLEKAKQLSVQDVFCWMIDTASNRLIIHENQVPDFYGLKAGLEDALYRASFQSGETSRDAGQISQTGQGKARWSREELQKLPWVNIFLVAVNVIVFLIYTFTGDLLYNKGAFGAMDIIEDRAYYRIFTSMFLHANIQHLFSNMIVLYYVGEIVEKKLGHIPYVIIYFLSGIAGDVMSMVYEFYSGEYISSIGASGAVFGIEGALLLLALFNQSTRKNLSAGKVAFAIAFSLYCGFTSTNVNNAAHVGGLLMGFAAAGILWVFTPHIREKG